MGTETVAVIRAGDRSMPEVATAGMERQQAYAAGGVWIGTVRTQPGVATGWHHHGDYESWIYVLGGRARMEFGPGGHEVEVGQAGDLIHVPKGVVHREVTEGAEPVDAVLFRVGSGQVTYNTDGPASDVPD